jgi:tetratricopeptide (TPR) repeat protein
VDQPDQQRDLFISYTQADRAWAEWLAWELEAAGYTTLLQAWDMPPGTAFVHVMHQATTTTRHTLLVLSPAYLRSAMTEAEWRPGFVADPSGEDRRLVPVRVEPCEPKGLLADRVYLDLVGVDEAGARARLHEGVAAALRGHGRPSSPPRFPRVPVQAAVDRPRFPTALPPVWNVPYRRNPAFTGREQDLAVLADQLGRGAATAVTQAVQGSGGIGKTALAVEYAYQHRSEFDTVWWVRAEEPASLISDYAALAGALGLPAAGEADQQVVAAAVVRSWLDGHDRWLLILDNAQDPDTLTGLRPPLARLVDLLPPVLHGQVLVTSRDARWDRYATLAELELFTPEEAAAFLLARAGSSDQAGAAEVAKLLGLLPLALEQAGAYVRETRLPLATYLERLRRFPALTVARGRPRDRDPADTVATTWRVSLERVRPVPGAVGLLEVCAFLGPEEISRELFATRLDPPAAELAMLAEDPFALDEAVAALHRFGLVKASEHTLVVHRLLQQVLCDQLDPTAASNRAGTAVRLLAEAFPLEGFEDPTVWPRCAQLLPHAVVAADHAERYQAERAATSELLDSAAGYLRGRARYAEARTLAQRALALAETADGPEDEAIATRLSNLAAVLYAQGELDTARTLYERALAIYKARLGPDDPGTLATRLSLAFVLGELGHLVEAEAEYRSVLDLRRRLLGPDHPDTLGTRHALAWLLQVRGRAEAEAEYRQIIQLQRRTLGYEHPATLSTRRALAYALQARGRLAEAEAEYRQIIQLQRRTLGYEDPTMLGTRHNLARVLQEQGQLDQAETEYQAVLQGRQRILGPNHRDTLGTRHALAWLLQARGHLGEAEAEYRAILELQQQGLGPDHPDTLGTRHNLASLLQTRGYLDEAEAMLRSVLELRRRVLGPDHPDTVRSRERLAAVVADLENRR